MDDLERRYNEARQALQEWIDKQGHNRCWYYPEIFRKLVLIFGITSSSDPSLPPIEEFRKGCNRYQEEEYRLPQSRE